MDVKVCVRNLCKSTTQWDLDTLFERAGDVRAIQIMKSRKTGESLGFAIITMSAQSEADKAVSLFNRHVLDEHFLSVELIRPRKQRGFDKRS